MYRINILAYFSLLINLYIHELGHFIIASILGYDVSIHIGDIHGGKKKYLFKIKNTYIYNPLVAMGYCRYNKKYLKMPKIHNILISLAGILFNILGLIVIYYLKTNKLFSIETCEIFKQTSYCCILINLIPFKWPVLNFESDGLRIIKLIRSGNNE